MSNVTSCGWMHLDAIGTAASNDGEAQDGAPPYLDASLDADVSDATYEAEVSSDAELVAASTDSDVPDALDASDSALPPDGATSNDPCMGSQTPVRQWTFDSNAQGWLLSMNAGVQGSLTWTGTIGMPAPGALQIDVNPGRASLGAWARYVAMPVGDLSGRTISAWLWLESGPTPRVKLYVQTGTQYTWADNGTISLALRAWTCVSVAVSAPSYTNGPNYDPTNVVRLGFELLSNSASPFRIYVDTVRY
ncbi:MAG: hypothetical protein M3O46_05280 [Myxococcota bacterium]|nr:hypothetical protein [Myxococcota bacterium]